MRGFRKFIIIYFACFVVILGFVGIFAWILVGYTELSVSSFYLPLHFLSAHHTHTLSLSLSLSLCLHHISLCLFLVPTC